MIARGRLQLADRLLADHAPVGHDAHRADGEALLQTIDDRDQGLGVGDVARPQFATNRPAGAVEQHSQNQLLAVGAMVFAVAVAAQRLAAVALEVDRGGVEEHQVELAEQVAAAAEPGFLDQVLGAARAEGRGGALVGQLLAEPGHGSIEVMQFQHLGAVDAVGVSPAFGGSVAAGGEQTVQHGQEDGPFDGELEAAVGQQRRQERG